jgi:purine-binding chemotaxis protein CheW
VSRRKDGTPPAGGGRAGGEAARIRLPDSGMAEDILAALDSGAGFPVAPAPVPDLPAFSQLGGSGIASGRDRVFAFADTLAGREREQEAPREQPESWVTFALASETYALPVEAVQEILRPGAITRVPHAPAPVRGITNLRGRVLAVVDLRVRLGLPPAEPDERSRILVVASRERTLGLLVDGARQVLKLLPSAVQPPPADILTARSDFLRGVYHLADELVVLLDVERVLLVQD